MKTNKAILGGIIGAAAMSVLMAAARAMGMKVMLEQMLGTMTGMMPSATTFAIGFGIHLMMGAVFGALYGWVFEHATHRGHWSAGALVALPHVVIVGLMMGAMPLIHPLMPAPMPPPGVFMSQLGGMGVMAMLMLHVIFGAIVGAVYGEVHERGRAGMRTGRLSAA